MAETIFKLSEAQTYTYVISGLVRAKIAKVKDYPYGPEYPDIYNYGYYSEHGIAYGEVGIGVMGAQFRIWVKPDVFEASSADQTFWQIGWDEINEGDSTQVALPSTYDSNLGYYCADDTDITVPFVLTITAPVERIGMVEQIATGTSDPYSAYPTDDNPDWIPNQRLVCAERIAEGSEIGVTFEVNEEEVFSDTLTAATDVLNPGGMSGWISIGSDSVTGVVNPLDDEGTTEYMGEVGEISFSRDGQAGPNYPYRAWSGNDGTHVEIEGDTLTVYSNGDYTYHTSTLSVGTVHALIDNCGAFDHIYTGNVKYLDETAMSITPQLFVTDEVPTESGGVWSTSGAGTSFAANGAGATLSFDGWFELDLDGEDEEEYADYRCINTIERTSGPIQGYYRRLGNVVVSNVAALGEPSEASYEDCRCYVPCNTIAPWTRWDALRFAVAQSPVTLLSFPYSDAARLSLGPNVVLTNDDGNIHINNTHGTESSYVEREFDPSDGTDSQGQATLQGARSLSVDDSTDEALPYTFEIAGREYERGGLYGLHDVLNCGNGLDGSSETRSIVDSLAPNAGSESDVPVEWGIYRPGVVRWNLAPSEERTILPLRGLPQDAWVIILPQAYWYVGQSPTVDTFTAEYAGNSGSADAYYITMGYLIIDGLVAGQIVGVVHINTEGVWTQSLPALEVEGFRCFPEPSNGMFTAQELTGSGEFPVVDRSGGVAYLDPGTYTPDESGEITIPATLKVDEIQVPPRWESVSFPAYKRYGARLFIRIVEIDGNTGPFRMRITSGLGAVESQTDSNGLLLSGVVPMSGTCTIDIIDGDPDVSFTVERRNRLLSIITVRCTIPPDIPDPEEGAESDILHDELTGMTVAAYASGGALSVRTSNNYAAGFGVAKPIAVEHASKPCVLHDKSSLWRWGVAWQDASTGAVKIAWSTNQFNDIVVETVMTGLTNVRIRKHPMTGIMIAAGWHTASGAIKAAQSIDDGANWSTAVSVVTCAEQAFGLDTLANSLNEWCISYIDGSGNLQIVKSNDNGLTWS